MPLDISFLDLIAQCAPSAEIREVAAILDVQSGVNRLAVRVSGRQPVVAASTGEAMAIAVDALNRGHQVAMGIGGLNERMLRRVGLGLADAFDVCASIQVVADALGKPQSSLNFYRALRDGDSYQPDAEAAFAESVAAARKATDLQIEAIQESRPRAIATGDAPAGVVTARVAPPWDVFGRSGGASVLVFSQGVQGKGDQAGD